MENFRGHFVIFLKIGNQFIIFFENFVGVNLKSLKNMMTRMQNLEKFKKEEIWNSLNLTRTNTS